MTEATKKRRLVSVNPLDARLSIFAPPDDEGEQHIATVYEPPVDTWTPAMQRAMAVVGFNTTASNTYNRQDDQSVEAIEAAMVKLSDALVDGTWTPGRTFEPGEPPDIIVAIAEATGKPVFMVQQEIDESYARDAAGNFVLDARGRRKKLITQRVLDRIAREDPNVAPIMARLASERARTAKKSGGTPGLLDLFTKGDTAAAAQ